jgi:DNA-binding CsgD family transcriptional regulator
VRGDRSDGLGLRGPVAGLLIGDPDEAPRPDPAAVAHVLGLTAKEAALAVAIAQGRTIDEAARAEGVSPAAMRKRLYRLFEKLGIHRQSELVRLVGATAGAGAEPL